METSIVRLLVDTNGHGPADIREMTRDTSETALQVAERRNKVDVANYLRQALAALEAEEAGQRQDDDTGLAQGIVNLSSPNI